MPNDQTMSTQPSVYPRGQGGMTMGRPMGTFGGFDSPRGTSTIHSDMYNLRQSDREMIQNRRSPFDNMSRVSWRLYHYNHNQWANRLSFLLVSFAIGMIVGGVTTNIPSALSETNVCARGPSTRGNESSYVVSHGCMLYNHYWRSDISHCYASTLSQEAIGKMPVNQPTLIVTKRDSMTAISGCSVEVCRKRGVDGEHGDLVLGPECCNGVIEDPVVYRPQMDEDGYASVWTDLYASGLDVIGLYEGDELAEGSCEYAVCSAPKSFQCWPSIGIATANIIMAGFFYLIIKLYFIVNREMLSSFVNAEWYFLMMILFVIYFMTSQVSEIATVSQASLHMNKGSSSLGFQIYPVQYMYVGYGPNCFTIGCILGIYDEVILRLEKTNSILRGAKRIVHQSYDFAASMEREEKVAYAMAAAMEEEAATEDEESMTQDKEILSTVSTAGVNKSTVNLTVTESKSFCPSETDRGTFDESQNDSTTTRPVYDLRGNTAPQSSCSESTSSDFGMFDLEGEKKRETNGDYQSFIHGKEMAVFQHQLILQRKKQINALANLRHYMSYLSFHHDHVMESIPLAWQKNSECFMQRPRRGYLLSYRDFSFHSNLYGPLAACVGWFLIIYDAYISRESYHKTDRSFEHSYLLLASTVNDHHFDDLERITHSALANPIDVLSAHSYSGDDIMTYIAIGGIMAIIFWAINRRSMVSPDYYINQGLMIDAALCICSHLALEPCEVVTDSETRTPNWVTIGQDWDPDAPEPAFDQSSRIQREWVFPMEVIYIMHALKERVVRLSPKRNQTLLHKKKLFTTVNLSTSKGDIRLKDSSLKRLENRWMQIQANFLEFGIAFSIVLIRTQGFSTLTFFALYAMYGMHVLIGDYQLALKSCLAFAGTTLSAIVLVIIMTKFVPHYLKNPLVQIVINLVNMVIYSLAIYYIPRMDKTALASFHAKSTIMISCLLLLSVLKITATGAYLNSIQVIPKDIAQQSARSRKKTRRRAEKRRLKNASPFHMTESSSTPMLASPASGEQDERGKCRPGCTWFRRLKRNISIKSQTFWSIFWPESLGGLDQLRDYLRCSSYNVELMEKLYARMLTESDPITPLEEAVQHQIGVDVFKKDELYLRSVFYLWLSKTRNIHCLFVPQLSVGLILYVTAVILGYFLFDGYGTGTRDPMIIYLLWYTVTISGVRAVVLYLLTAPFKSRSCGYEAVTEMMNRRK